MITGAFVGQDYGSGSAASAGRVSSLRALSKETFSRRPRQNSVDVSRCLNTNASTWTEASIDGSATESNRLSRSGGKSYGSHGVRLERWNPSTEGYKRTGDGKLGVSYGLQLHTPLPSSEQSRVDSEPEWFT